MGCDPDHSIFVGVEFDDESLSFLPEKYQTMLKNYGEAMINGLTYSPIHVGDVLCGLGVKVFSHYSWDFREVDLHELAEEADSIMPLVIEQFKTWGCKHKVKVISTNDISW